MRALITIGSGPCGLVPTLGPGRLCGAGLDGATGRRFAASSWERSSLLMASSAPTAMGIAAARRAAAINDAAKIRTDRLRIAIAHISMGVCFPPSHFVRYARLGVADVSGNKRFSEARGSCAVAGT